MSSPPPPPQISPDGRYYWDGQMWRPLQQPALPGPASQPSPPSAPALQQPQVLVLYKPNTNGLAVTSLIFGIVSWFVCALIGGIVAVVCGHVAHSQIKRTGEGGSGLATAGLVLGYLNIAASAVLVIWIFLVLGGLAAFFAALGAASASPTP